MNRPIAAFDFDGTLLDGDCLLILHSLVRSPLGRMNDGLRLLPALMLWKSGLLSTALFKQAVLQRLLTPAMQVRALPQHRGLIVQQALKPRLHEQCTECGLGLAEFVLINQWLLHCAQPEGAGEESCCSHQHPDPTNSLEHLSNVR